jgi:hypothetical protein
MHCDVLNNKSNALVVGLNGRETVDWRRRACSRERTQKQLVQNVCSSFTTAGARQI